MSAHWDDEFAEFGQKFRRKTRKPQGRRKIADLKGSMGDVTDDTVRRLLDLGHITEVVCELKSGKEATAYIA